MPTSNKTRLVLALIPFLLLAPITGPAASTVEKKQTTQLSAEEAGKEIQNAMNQVGYNVFQHETTPDGDAVLSLELNTSSKDEVADAVQDFAFIYTEAVEKGFTGDLTVKLHESPGDQAGSFQLIPEWPIQHLNAQLTTGEYQSNIFDTIRGDVARPSIYGSLSKRFANSSVEFVGDHSDTFSAAYFIQEQLREQGYGVNVHGGDGHYIAGQYGSSATDQYELAQEIGEFIMVYAEAVERYDAGSMRVAVANEDGEVVGSYYVLEEWAEAYNQGELTAEEYFQLVIANNEHL